MIIGLVFGAAIFVCAHLLAARVLRVRGLWPHRFRYEADRAPRWRELWVRLSGPVAIYLSAVTCFAVYTRINGTFGTLVGVGDGYPAARAGMRDGDRILAIDGEPLRYFHEAADRVRARGPNGRISLTYRRATEERTIELVINEAGLIGVRPTEQVGVGIIDAFAGALPQPFRAPSSWARGVMLELTQPAEGTVGGPVMIARDPSGRQENPIARWATFLGFHLSLTLPLFTAYALLLAMIDLFMARARRTENSAIGGGSNVP
jgi:membrane-associated protease RseP (regulator of RpoE activity)